MESRSKLFRLPANWILGIVALSALPVLKAGDVQLLEALQALRLLAVILVALYAGWRVPATGVWREWGKWHLAFLAACIGLAVFSLRLPFFPFPELSLLKRPLVISLARTAELMLDMYFMFAVADGLRRSETLRRKALDAYWMLGAVSAILSLIGAVVMKLTGIDTYFAYGDQVRVRGFFNEAGPYGIYLVSVLLVLWLRAQYFPTGMRLLRQIAVPLVLAALLQSQSKAAFVALIAICLLVGLFVAKMRQRIAMIAGVLLVCATAWLFLSDRFLNYANDYIDYEDILPNRADDPSFVMGRIAAAFLVPRMIAAHPVAGIGIGNYSLMRNDPEYLQGLPPVKEWDLPGLGLVGLTAELGVPLAVFLLLLLLRPLFKIKRLKVPWILLMCTGFQCVAVLAGVNLNFFYPWLITAFALSFVPDVAWSGSRQAGKRSPRPLTGLAGREMPA